MINYIDQFGYIVLFTALMLEYIALPLPGQTLMTYVGFLVYQGHLDWSISIFMAWAGSCTGMTITYVIGKRFGTPLLTKYGHLFHMNPKRLEIASKWFNKHGSKMLLFSYFIPGVRHVTGYFSGVTQHRFSSFMLLAYTGALIWSATFITLGKFLGPQWDKLHDIAKKYILIGLSVVIAFLIISFIYHRFKQRTLCKKISPKNTN